MNTSVVGTIGAARSCRVNRRKERKGGPGSQPQALCVEEQNLRKKGKSKGKLDVNSMEAELS